MRKIVYERPDGAIAVVHPVRNTFPVEEDMTDEQVEQRAWDKLPADAVNPRFVAEDEIPADRTFREAWKLDLTVDMDTARAIHRDRMRAARKPRLEALDVEYQRADERGDAEGKQSVAIRKQALRDVTANSAIDAATTPDELKAVWPDCLTGA